MKTAAQRRARGKHILSSVRATEESEQLELAAWLDQCRLTWIHVPNEIRCKPQYAQKRKQLGVRSGVPDVLIFDAPPLRPGLVGAAVELKRRGGRVQASQQAWIRALAERRWYATVAWGAEDAITILKGLGYGTGR